MLIASAYAQRMKTTQLRTLVAIAEHGTLMAAAEALSLSQPAVSKGIKELEARLGVQLLVRSGAGVRLTPYGEALLRRARTVVAEIARAEQELKEMKSSSDRKLSVGVSRLAALLAMPDAIRAFRRRLPDVQLSVEEYQARQLIDGLRDGTFELCVAVIADSDVMAELCVVPLRVASQSLAVKRGDPLEAEHRLTRLRDAHWLYNYTRESVPAFWSELTAKESMDCPKHVSVCTSPRLYVELAQEPGTVSVWPDFLLNEQVERGILTRIETDAKLPQLTLGLMYRKDLVFGSAAEYFVECVRNTSSDKAIASSMDAF
jgi:LysR family transcriptional regulator of abg operon